MRILHVNNIAFVGEQLCKDLRKEMHEAKLIDTDKLGNKNWRTYLTVLKEVLFGRWDIVHIHYPAKPISVLASLHPRTIVHFHGSDTRVSPYRQMLVKLTCLNTKILLFSTPDLYNNIEWLTKRKLFFPNYIKEHPNIHNNYSKPVDHNNYSKPVDHNNYSKPVDHNNYSKPVLLFSRISDKLKGIDKYGDLLNDFRDLHAIEFGEDVEKYKQKFSHIHWIKPFDHDLLPEILKNYSFVLGQKTGQIGVAELEAMSYGIPTHFDFNYNKWYKEKVPIAKNNNSVIGEKQRQWVRKYHNKKTLIPKLIKIYKEVIKNSKNSKRSFDYSRLLEV